MNTNTINAKDLKAILARLEKNINAKDIARSENTVITVEANNGSLNMSSTDFENTMNVEVCKTTEECNSKLYLNKKDITKIKKLSGAIKFDFKNNQVKSEKIALNLGVYPDLEHYDIMIDNLNATPLFMNDEIKNNFKTIVKIVDKNNPKFELNGLLMENIDNKLTYVATDTRRLCYIEDNDNTHDDFEIIPNKHGLELVDFENVDYMLTSDTHLIVKEKNITHTIKLINGKYPQYRRIIPTSLNVNQVFKYDTLLNAFKECNKFTNIVQFKSEKSINFIEDETQNISGEFTDKNLNFDKKYFELAFDIKYGIEALNNKNSDIVIGVNEANLPFTINNGVLNTVIMPIIAIK